jgi:hypothetical protein
MEPLTEPKKQFVAYMYTSRRTGRRMLGIFRVYSDRDGNSLLFRNGRAYFYRPADPNNNRPDALISFGARGAVYILGYNIVPGTCYPTPEPFQFRP